MNVILILGVNMPEQVQETSETIVESGGVVSKNQVTKQGSVVSPASKVEQVIYLLLGILESVLAIRVLLSLLGANRGNAFASLIYSVSYPFVAPFFGLFGYKFEYGVARLEVESIVAMIVYGLIGWGIVKLTRIGRN